MAFQKITESESLYDNLDQMSVRELLEGINNEDRKVAIAVGREIPKIENLVTRIVERMRRGGRLFYIGAGTSGRLGVLDASEIPPTYGMPNTLVIGLIAGGDRALRNPVESAEDDLDKAWEELQQEVIKVRNQDPVTSRKLVSKVVRCLYRDVYLNLVSRILTALNTKLSIFLHYRAWLKLSSSLRLASTN